MRLAIILIVIFSVFKAQAALITIGSFSIDETRFADSVVLVSGTSVKPPSNAEGLILTLMCRLTLLVKSRRLLTTFNF